MVVSAEVEPSKYQPVFAVPSFTVIWPLVASVVEEVEVIFSRTLA
jgi:hypothetical protein